MTNHALILVFLGTGGGLMRLFFEMVILRKIYIGQKLTNIIRRFLGFSTAILFILALILYFHDEKPIKKPFEKNEIHDILPAVTYSIGHERHQL